MSWIKIKLILFNDDGILGELTIPLKKSNLLGAYVSVWVDKIG